MEQKKAGIDRFQKYGVFNLIDALAGGNVLKWEAIMELPYVDVYKKLLLFKDEAGFQKDYHQVIAEKFKVTKR